VAFENFTHLFLIAKVVREGQLQERSGIAGRDRGLPAKAQPESKTLSLACQGTRNFGQARARQQSGCRSLKLKPLFAAEAQHIEHQHDSSKLRNLILIYSWLDARSEEGEYLLWSSTDERQSSQPKDAQPGGLR
jgi:hypothetical protein